MVSAIPTGVSLAEFAPRPPDPDLKAGLNFPAGSFIFGTVSVLRSWKGHLFILEALKKLVEAGKPCCLLIVGDGPYLEVIEERLSALNLSPYARLTGYQDRVAYWLALMDALVMASYAHEGVPQAVLQAMAMAKPVVATTVGGIPEVIIPELTGLLVPPNDPEALAQAMARLMDDEPLRENLGRQGINLVAAKYSLEHMAEQLEAVLPRTCGLSLPRAGRREFVVVCEHFAKRDGAREFKIIIPEDDRHETINHSQVRSELFPALCVAAGDDGLWQ